MVGLQMDRVSVVSRVTLVNSGKAPSILVTASADPLHSAGGRGPESVVAVIVLARAFSEMQAAACPGDIIFDKPMR
jgi:hypothetical protein